MFRVNSIDVGEVGGHTLTVQAQTLHQTITTAPTMSFNLFILIDPCRTLDHAASLVVRLNYYLGKRTNYAFTRYNKLVTEKCVVTYAIEVPDKIKPYLTTRAGVDGETGAWIVETGDKDLIGDYEVTEKALTYGSHVYSVRKFKLQVLAASNLERIVATSSTFAAIATFTFFG